MRSYATAAVPVALTFALAGGCTSPAVHHGHVVETPGSQREGAAGPGIGARFLDFSYVDDEGNRQRLEDHLGDYTFLIFTRCGDEMHTRASKEIRQLVHATEDRRFNQIVAFDVYRTDGACGPGDPCRLSERDSTYFSICDPGGEVADLYGVGHQNEIVVIGPDHRIIDEAAVASLDELKDRVKERIAQYTANKSVWLTRAGS